MSDGILIREATHGDLPAVVALLADDELGATREKLTDPLPKAYTEAFDAMAEQGGNHLLVACDAAGLVVGCLQLLILPHISRMGMPRAQIEGVRVAASHRNLGLGRTLFDHAIQRARASECGMVQLTTDAERPDAKRFYESLGFKASHIGMKLNLEISVPQTQSLS